MIWLFIVLKFHSDTDRPDAPDAPTVNEIYNSKCKICWKPPGFDGGSQITGYFIERKSELTPRWIRINKDPVSDLEFIMNDLVEDNSYQFRIVAVNKAGESDPSKPSEPVVAKDPWRK